MNKRFPVLSFFSVVVRIIGWLIIVVGVISSVKQWMAYAECVPRCSLNVSWLMTNVSLLVGGCVTAVLGETIGVAFAIEENTRRLVELWISEAGGSEE